MKGFFEVPGYPGFWIANKEKKKWESDVFVCVRRTTRTTTKFYTVKKSGFDKLIRDILGGRPHDAAGWPRESEAMGVDPSLIGEYREYDAKYGVPTTYNPETGNPIFTDVRHEQRYLAAHGAFQRNGGYRDQQKR